MPLLLIKNSKVNVATEVKNILKYLLLNIFHEKKPIFNCIVNDIITKFYHDNLY